jgi:hypothetical protein
MVTYEIHRWSFNASKHVILIHYGLSTEVNVIMTHFYSNIFMQEYHDWFKCEPLMYCLDCCQYLKHGLYKKTGLLTQVISQDC